LEHVEWARHIPPPAQFRIATLDQDLEDALQVLCDLEPADLDKVRAQRLLTVFHVAQELAGQQVAWARGAPAVLQPLVMKLHGPLFQWLAEVLDYPDRQLLVDLQQGFRLTGLLPPCPVAAKLDVPKTCSITESQLRSSIAEFNDATIQKLRSTDYADDVWSDLSVDIQLGAISEASPLVEADAVDKLLTRRLTVREERAKGWRTRVCDHCTESGLNLAVQAVDRPTHDTLDVAAAMLSYAASRGVHIQFWKRDVSRAFRRIPLWPGHQDLAWVIWRVEEQLWKAQQRATGFGPTGAVYAWHRTGSFTRDVLRKLFIVAVGRYVDDYYGTDKRGSVVSGGLATSILLTLLGLPTDEEKSDDFTESIQILGVVLTYVPRTLSTTGMIDPVKAVKWAGQLQEVYELGTCTSGLAAKMAGRLAHSVSATADRVGRAYIAPWYAQQHCPLKFNKASAALVRSARWFRNYLLLRVPVVRAGPLEERDHHITWSDAAGASRMIAAVALLKGRFFYTTYKIPDQLWDQLLPRRDEQIQFAELAGTILTWCTFKEALKGMLWTCFMDNQAVEKSVIRAAGGTPESNLAIGRLWMEWASSRTAVEMWRVESHANIADGPSRSAFLELEQLGATFVDPVIPPWFEDIWCGMQQPC